MDSAGVGLRAPVSLNLSTLSEKTEYGFKPSQHIDVDFMVGCNATLQADAPQAPVLKQDIVLVLDVSGSMGGPLGNMHTALGGCSRIELVKSSCQWLLRNLPREHTSVGIVSFHSHAAIVHPLKPLKTHLDSLLGSVAELRPEDGTNMWEGMQLGSSVLLNKAEGLPQSLSSKSMIVLSDGDVNEGRTDIAAAVAETSDYTQMELWMFAISTAANTKLCEAAVRSCGGTLIAISDPEAVPAAFGSFCGAERLVEQFSLTLAPNDRAEFSVSSISVQNRSTNASEVQVALGFLMKEMPRHVLFRARVQLPEAAPADGNLVLGSLSSWCLAPSGDISIQVPLCIKLSSSADDGPVNVQVAKAFQKEAVAVAMRSGDVQKMRELADKLQKSSAAEEFKSDISILLQLAKDFEDRREDVYMNSMQMAQECSNNRSMQSAPRFVASKSAMCSPSISWGSAQARSAVSEELSLKSKPSTLQSPHHGQPRPATPQQLPAAVQQPVAPQIPSRAPDAAAAPAAPGIFSSVMSGIRGLSSSIFGSGSSDPEAK